MQPHQKKGLTKKELASIAIIVGTLGFAGRDLLHHSLQGTEANDQRSTEVTPPQSKEGSNPSSALDHPSRKNEGEISSERSQNVTEELQENLEYLISKIRPDLQTENELQRWHRSYIRNTPNGTEYITLLWEPIPSRQIEDPVPEEERHFFFETQLHDDAYYYRCEFRPGANGPKIDHFNIHEHALIKGCGKEIIAVRNEDIPNVDPALIQYVIGINKKITDDWIDAVEEGRWNTKTFGLEG